MKKLCAISLVIFCCTSALSFAAITPILPGDPVWCVDKRIASTTDHIESVVQLVESQLEAFLTNSQSAVAIPSLTYQINQLIISISGIDSVYADVSLMGILLTSQTDTFCSPTVITSNVSTTITAEGIYCLNQAVTGTITIAANNVQLNLNGYVVTGSIVVNNGVSQVTIQSGTVIGTTSTDGITLNPGASSININNVLIKNSQRGIYCNGSHASTISNCELTHNVTGIQLNSAYTMNIQGCTAQRNIHAGFDLISSSTNSFIECKALATGQNNAVIYNNEVVGFSSSNGYGNIFERCIANGTQALSTSDSSSVIAGFVLSGTEGCSKIINSESANAITSSSGVTIPYGILLQGSFNGLSTITGYFALSSGDINTAKWSPDGQYLAVVGNDMTIGLGNDLQILSFNRVSESLTPVAGFFTTAENVNTVSWSPDGQYLAVGGSGLTSGLGEQLQIFQFNRMNNTLQVVAGYFGSSALINWVDWSSDGQYLVVGCLFTYPGMQVFSFNKITNTLTMVAGAINTGDVFTTSWSPDGQYVAVGGSNITDGYGGNTQLQIFQFNRSNNSLTVVAGNLGGISGVVNAISWSPDGQYLAIGGGAFSAGLGAYDFQIFQFNRLNNNLIPLAGAVYDPTNQYSCFSVSWSSDGQYVAIGTDDNSLGMTVYSFNQSTQMLSLVANSLIIASGNWSPDGQYLAIADFNATNNKLQIFTGLQFPSQNVITGNTVYCNGQSVTATFTGAVGVGISGSSIGNMITGNTAYNNPPVSSNFFVPSNYYFVTNVFNQAFGQGPTELQNISLNGNTPIISPDNIALLVQQATANVSSSLATVLTALSSIQNNLNQASSCNTNVTAATTLSVAGNYLVCNSITGNIAITSSNVHLNLNKLTVTGTISIASSLSNIVIENGVVNANGGTNGILVNSGASNVLLSSVLVQNAILGVQFTSGSQSTVQNCTLIGNTTGIQIQNSSQIAVSSTIALNNTNAGFDVISSSTNSFFDCEALATGMGNTAVTNNFVAGFTSYNGYGNIFERCIANGTQALSTTDSSSVVAGFALRGTEGCSKIINSESANAIASSSGVTIPYGILLQGSLSSISAVTGTFPQASNTSVNEVSWSPDGNYLAVAGNGLTSNLATQVQLYSFNRVNGSVTAVAGVLSSGTVNTVSWSPDGLYLAVGGVGLTSNDLQIFQFNRMSNTLMSVAGFFTTSETINSVSWSYDGLYLIVGGTNGITSGFATTAQVLSFNRVANSLSAVSGLLSGTVNSVSWSPDGLYAVVGGTGLGTNDVKIFSFNRSTNSLALVTGILSNTDVVNAVSWGPAGQYIALGGSTISGGLGTQLQILLFNRTTLMLSAVAGLFASGNVLESVAWDSDGQYVAIGGTTITGGLATYLQLIQFNRSTQTLTPIAGALTAGTVNSVVWSPDGQYIAVGGTGLTSNFGFDVELFTALQFPSQNVISGNTVYCTGQSISTPFIGAVGVGISGSSIGNMIIGNTAYDNPPVSSNFFVPSNYYFVTNVFNQLFGQGPMAIQNISLNGNTSILAPDNTILLAQQLYNDVVQMQSATNAITFLNTMATDVNLLVSCLATSVTTATTLSVSGIYRLCNAITGAITITASQVDLNLADFKVTGGIVVSGSNVTIHNGIVTTVSGNAIAATNVSGLTVRDVICKGSGIGVNFTNVSSSYFFHCDLLGNQTGIFLKGCDDIYVENCNALSNSFAGFSLASTYSSSLIDCKALATGSGNTTVFNNAVMGFVSSSGYGNIFERCIANGTQALSTTDSNSIIAGLALLNNELNSKIISCESSNAQTSSSGVAGPYGIFLQSSLSQISSVTGTFAQGANTEIRSIKWSPDGQFLAVGGDGLNSNFAAAFQVYRFDRPTNNPVALVGLFTKSTDYIYSVDWSPNGSYVAVGGYNLLTEGANTQMQVLLFDRTNNSLIAVAGALTNSANLVYSVNWSSDGHYIAVGGTDLTSSTLGTQLQIYFFDSTRYTLAAVAGAFTNLFDTIFSVNWNPAGNYIAVAGYLLDGFGTGLQILGFNSGSNVLTNVAGLLNNVLAVNWSPDGNYLAVGGSSTSGGLNTNLQILKFNTATNMLTAVASALTSNTNPVNVVNWSADGQYVAVGGSGLGNNLQVFRFNAASATLTNVTGGLATGSNPVYALNWSPDGQYIAAGGNNLTTNLFQIFSALQFPSGNVISNNTVMCNSQSVVAAFTGTVGTGIYGSSVSNQIINNVSYNHLFNYTFAQNVFNQNIGVGPALVQTIGVTQLTPVRQPLDVDTEMLAIGSLLENLILFVH